MRRAAALGVELRQAANTVAAHLGLGAVRVEDAHPHIRTLGRQRQDQAIGADTEMAVARLGGERRPVALAGGGAVQQDEVVAGAVQLRELHRITGSSIRTKSRSRALAAASGLASKASQWMRGSDGLNQLFWCRTKRCVSVLMCSIAVARSSSPARCWQI